MTRRIVSIAGPMAQFAIADDGTGWYWDGTRWLPWERAPLPQPEEKSVGALVAESAAMLRTPLNDPEGERLLRDTFSPAEENQLAEATNTDPGVLPPRVWRGPGRPRKNLR